MTRTTYKYSKDREIRNDLVRCYIIRLRELRKMKNGGTTTHLLQDINHTIKALIDRIKHLRGSNYNGTK